jgi:muramoyltetrapeptide carboxypeptidase
MKPCVPPPPLQPGDKLCVIAPSGTLRETAAVHAGLDLWRTQGYRVEVLPGVDGRWGYLAGTDAQRRQQLAQAIADPDCRGILCARGGYGGARLLESFALDPWTIKTLPPKWLVGFSDITALHWFLAQHQISGVHGPLLTTLGTEPAWSLDRLFGWVQGTPLGILHGTGWGGGRAQGLLLPVNLTVATHLLGTALQPDLRGVILAIEDVSEAPYRIDRMLTQWRMMGLLQQVSGIAIGRFSQCDPPATIPSFSVAEVLRDRLGTLGLPIVADLPFGHDGENAALPVGVPCQLDGDRGFLDILSAD